MGEADTNEALRGSHRLTHMNPIGLIGTNIFLDREGPRYPTGYGTALGVICLGCGAAVTLEFFLWTANKKKAQQSESEIREQYTDQELDRMGERSPLYKYTL